MELGFDEFPGLICVAAVDSVFAGAAFEEGACETDGAERGDDTPCPEDEAPAGTTDAMQEILVVGVDKEEADDLFHVAGGEDTRYDASCSSGDQDVRAFFAFLCEGFGERIGGHSCGVWGGSIVGEGVAWAVPVAVARDGLILVRGVGPVLQVVLEGILAGFEEDGGIFLFAGVCHVADACEMDGILVAVDEDTAAVHSESRIASTNAQSAGHEDDNYDKDGGKDRRDQNGNPFLQSSTCLCASSETFLLFTLTICNHAISQNAPDGHHESEDDTGNANPAFLEANARDGKDHDHINGQEDRNDGGCNT